MALKPGRKLMETRFQHQHILTQYMRRRHFLKGITVAAGGIALTPFLNACSDANATGGPVTLRFSSLPDQSEASNAQSFVAAFNKKYPEIRVDIEMLSSGDYHQKLLLQAASTSLPDLFWIEDQSVTVFAAKNTMLELDPYIQKTAFNVNDIYPSMLSLGQYKGKQYMLPRDYNHLVTTYNSSMFKAANVPLPSDGWTWEEFVSAAQKLVKKDAKGKTIQYGIDAANFNWWAIVVPAIRGFGGDVIDAHAKVIVDSPAATQGIEALYQLVKDGVATNFATAQTASFATNLAAMVFQVRPAMGGNKAVSEGKFTWNVTTFPRFPTPRVGTGASGYAISANTAHPDEAWKLLSFIVSPDGQKIFEQTGNSVPVLKSLQNDKDWLLPGLNNKAFVEFPEADTLPLELQLPPGAGGSTVSTDLTTLIGKVFLGLMTPRQMVAEWANRINQAIADVEQ